MDLPIPPVEVIFQEEMGKREKFVNYYDQNIHDIVLNGIQELNDKVKEKNGLLFIIGSRAWENNLKNKKELFDSLSPIQKNSILAGNYDVLIACPDVDSLNDIMINVCSNMDSIMYNLNENKDFQSTFVLEYKTNTGQNTTPLNYPFYVTSLNQNCGVLSPLSSIGCISPMCKAMHLEMTYKPLASTFKSQDLKSFKNKIVIYTECFVTSQEGISALKNNLLNGLFLNWKGLFLFSEMIVSRQKEYNIDSYRKEIMEKYFQTDELLKKNYYQSALIIYKTIFKNDNPNYISTLENLYKNYISFIYPDLITIVNGSIIEKFRKFINSFVYNLDTSKKIKNRTTAMFITGGDAYRRYIDTVKVTNDIDIKLFYTKNKKDILNLVIENICALVCILFVYKESILSSLQNTKVTTDGDITFQPLYNAGQFRIRYARRTNFTLVSLDYKYRIILSDDIKLYYTLPIIDVVLQKNATVVTKKEYMINYDEMLPIASPFYLKDDLYKIYSTISENLKMRVPKSSKDIQRFKNLLDYLEKNKDALKLQSSRGIKRKIEKFLTENGENKRVPPLVNSNLNVNADDSTPVKKDYLFIQLSTELKDTTFSLSRRFSSNLYLEMIDTNKILIEKYTEEFQKDFQTNKYLKEKINFNTIVEIYESLESNKQSEELSDLFSKIEL